MDTSSLTKKQKELFSKLTKLQKGIALNFLSGKSPAQSHKLAGGKCKNEENRKVLAHEILTKPNVKEFIDSVEVQVAEQVQKSKIMSRQEMAENLSLLGRTRINDVMELSNIEIEDLDGNVVPQAVAAFKNLEDTGYAIQEVKISKSGEVTIKTHDQKAAMKQLSELMGYNRNVDGEDGKLSQEEIVLGMIGGESVVSSDKLDE